MQMTSEEFIKRIKIAVYQTSIDSTLSLLDKPSGRRPWSSRIALSKWYNQLSVSDKVQVRETIKIAVRTTVLGILEVLDGVRSVRKAEEETGSLELRYSVGTESTLLNGRENDFLHDLFASEVPPGQT